MQVSFIVPLFNCLPLTQACIASLRRTLPARLRYEIILVDNGSTDGTGAWLATLGEPCRVIRNPSNLGYARANNLAAAQARGEVLCLINNDLVFRRGWFRPMFRLFRLLGRRAGAVGNVQRAVRTRRIDHSGIVVDIHGKPHHHRVWYPWPLQWRFVTAVTGACLMVRRETFVAIGGFDEGFVNGGEDVDLCLRLRRLGRINAVALRSVVLHHVSASAGRKAHDEANSQRLATRWRAEFARLAAWEWCWRDLERHWADPHSSQYWRDGLPSLLFVLGLRREVPVRVREGVEALMEVDFERWRRLRAGASGA